MLKLQSVNKQDPRLYTEHNLSLVKLMHGKEIWRKILQAITVFIPGWWWDSELIFILFFTFFSGCADFSMRSMLLSKLKEKKSYVKKIVNKTNDLVR